MMVIIMIIKYGDGEELKIGAEVIINTCQLL